MNWKPSARLAPFLIIYYLTIVYIMGFFADPDAFLVRLAPDSLDYISVADWIFHGTPSTMVERRAFFYPLIFGLARIPLGNIGIWFVQMALWTASAMIFHMNLEALVKSKKLRLFLLAVFCLVWSPIFLSMVVVTESLVLFLFSLIGTLLVTLSPKTPHRLVFPALLILVGILSVTKPNYLPLFGLVTAFTVLAKIRKKIHLSWSVLSIAVICSLIPMGVQIFLKHRSSTEAANNISSYVLEYYFYPQVLARHEHREFGEVFKEVTSIHPSREAMLGFLVSQPLDTFKTFIHNLEANLRDVFHVSEPAKPFEHRWRMVLNDIFYWLHVLFLLPTFILLWRLRRWNEPRDFVITLMALIFYIGILPTGLVFWSGDRLTVGLLAIWPMLYFTVIARIQELRATPAVTHT